MSKQETFLFDEGELITSDSIRLNMTPRRVKDIRKKFGMTQLKFAELLNLNYDTLRSWEGGYRHPSSPGYALLIIADKSPKAFLQNRAEILKSLKKYIKT
jgi:DNA-binding transcriptional regulator YiaG